jgi:hypothetical protein
MMGLNEADALQTKPYKMKKIIGNILFVASFIAWAAIAMLPLLSLSIEMAAAITMVLIVFGDIAFVLSIALLGKVFLEKMKIHIRKLFGKQ